MEAEQIGVVLARASELRSKLSLCIHDGENNSKTGGGAVGEEVEEVDGTSLVHIRDALVSLEQQLASLQNMQQQQLYERESSLAQIDRNRMILLQKLKDYKGKELGLIHETAAFAGETIRQDDDLLLPPYPSDLNDSLVLDDLYSSSFVAKYKSVRDGLASSSTGEAKSTFKESGKQAEHATNKWGGLKLVIGIIAKSALTIVSGIVLLNLAGYEPKFGKNRIQLRATDLLHRSIDREDQSHVQCPPGKFLVVENGEARCVVKERVEIPFDTNVTAPNLSYGFG